MNKLRVLLIGSLVAMMALVAIAAIGGMMMDANHIVVREATYTRSAPELWSTITRFDQMPQWRSDVDAVQIESGDPVRFVEMGEQGPVPMEVTEHDAPHRLVLMASSLDLPFSGTWTYELTEVEGGTRLRLTEAATIDNPVVRFVAHTFVDPADTAETYLVDLGQHLGETVTPQPPT